MKPVEFMKKTQAMEHLLAGGWTYRDVPQYGDRFFHKIEDRKLLCRVNECGGWNDSVCELKDSHVLYIAEVEISS